MNEPSEKVSMENFALLKVLGKGAYGKVFLVRKIGGSDHNTIYAMKVLRKTRVVSKQKTLEHTLAERQVLERLRGVPFLVQIYYAFQTDTKLHIVMEYVRGGELFTHLCSRGAFDLSSAKFVIAELIMAIDILHQKKIIYRDLKLENILIDEEGHIKLTDFGLSKLILPEGLMRANSYCGTIEYMSPEVVVDWWSMGVIAFELLTGCSPFTVDGGANSSRDIAKRILTKPVPFPKTMDAQAKTFITSLLDKKLERRLGFKGVNEIKNHPFLADIDWDAAANRHMKPFTVPSLTSEVDVGNFSNEFTNQPPLYSPADAPLDTNTLFRGYSYISPSVMLANNNVIGEEMLGEDMTTLLGSSPFFATYKLMTNEDGYLGRGSFSIVRKCIRLCDNKEFAVKIVSTRFASQAHNEAAILQLVKGHKNIIELIEVFSDAVHVYLVMELLRGQELLNRIRQSKQFTEGEASHIMNQLVSAVSYLHHKRIVHRDLKPENILFESDDDSATLRLIDFGFSRLLPDNSLGNQLKTPCYSLQYAAPEVLDVGDSLPQYNEQCDLWSLGVILYTMLSGQVPFHARSKGESASDIMARIKEGVIDMNGDDWRGISEEAKNLINSLLTVDPLKRLSITALSSHPWLCSSISCQTPLQTPSVLPTFAGETFNATLEAFLIANREGFHLLDVQAAPLLKRRVLKRQSGETGGTSCKKRTQFETVEEDGEGESTARPTRLGLSSEESFSKYRDPHPGAIRETRDSSDS
ncbi:rskn-2 [Pristionchus pacificus]|nr:rskn-2 [Pristionchus pacificus]|eukprot:PDM66712.1 rskn-2 [Pristionchus pacificus]